MSYRIDLVKNCQHNNCYWWDNYCICDDKNKIYFVSPFKSRCETFLSLLEKEKPIIYLANKKTYYCTLTNFIVKASAWGQGNSPSEAYDDWKKKRSERELPNCFK